MSHKAEWLIFALGFVYGVIWWELLSVVRDMWREWREKRSGK
jgi:hypothetical protein